MAAQRSRRLNCLNPLTALAFVAGRTDRLKVYTNILVLPYRNPFLTAKAAATLQIISGDRLLLGVGIGYQREEFEALGVRYEERGALMDEAIETIRQAWAGGPAVGQGRHFNAVGNAPRPVSRPAPPIWIARGSDKAVERWIVVDDPATIAMLGALYKSVVAEHSKAKRRRTTANGAEMTLQIVGRKMGLGSVTIVGLAEAREKAKAAKRLQLKPRIHRGTESRLC